MKKLLFSIFFFLSVLLSFSLIWWGFAFAEDYKPSKSDVLTLVKTKQKIVAKAKTDKDVELQKKYCDIMIAKYSKMKTKTAKKNVYIYTEIKKSLVAMQQKNTATTWNVSTWNTPTITSPTTQPQVTTRSRYDERNSRLDALYSGINLYGTGNKEKTQWLLSVIDRYLGEIENNYNWESAEKNSFLMDLYKWKVLIYLKLVDWVIDPNIIKSNRNSIKENTELWKKYASTPEEVKKADDVIGSSIRSIAIADEMIQRQNAIAGLKVWKQFTRDYATDWKTEAVYLVKWLYKIKAPVLSDRGAKTHKVWHLVSKKSWSKTLVINTFDGEMEDSFSVYDDGEYYFYMERSADYFWMFTISLVE